jgi:hypothetical protein
MPRQGLAFGALVFTLRCMSGDLAMSDTSPTRWTRTHVAKRLGISIATVRRMEGRDLHPTVDQRGIRYFAVAEVETLVGRRGREPERKPTDEGDVSARVFGLLRHGCDLRTIVITAKVHPRVVRTLYTEWLVSLQDGEARRQQEEFDAEDRREQARVARGRRRPGP